MTLLNLSRNHNSNSQANPILRSWEYLLVMSTDFCRAVLDRKMSEAGFLLKRLEDVGQVDPQVALVLLQLCGGYCKLVHLARAVPPSFSQSVLQIFDQDVQKCFTSCTGVHPSSVAWKQAQLSLSRGGLGLRSLSHHAPAAFIA